MSEGLTAEQRETLEDVIAAHRGCHPNDVARAVRVWYGDALAAAEDQRDQALTNLHAAHRDLAEARAALARVKAYADDQERRAAPLTQHGIRAALAGPDPVGGMYPYPTDTLEVLTTENRWHEISVRGIPARDLTPTQPAVRIDRLLHLATGGTPETGDPYAHVVAHRGTLYVHDGHHRYVLAMLTGNPLVCRVLDLNTEDDE